MIVVLKNKQYFLPDAWEDLSTEQYLFLLELLNDYTHNRIDASTVGINFAMYVLGIKKPKHLSLVQKEQFYENLAWLGEKATFWWVLKFENPKALDNIDPELRKQLKTHLPADLPQTPEVRVVARQKHWLEPNFTFAKNLIPKIGKAEGYTFSIDNKLMTTSLTAGQFSEAMTICNQFGSTNKPQLLNLLCQILYNTDINSKRFKNVSEVTKQGIYINFTAIMGYVTTRTKFALLFRPGKSKQAKITIGFNQNIYTLAKQGYGNTDELMKANLITFLDLLLNELIDSVKSMQSMEQDIGQIAHNTGLTVSQIKLIAP